VLRGGGAIVDGKHTVKGRAGVGSGVGWKQLSSHGKVGLVGLWQAQEVSVGPLDQLGLELVALVCVGEDGDGEAALGDQLERGELAEGSAAVPHNAHASIVAQHPGDADGVYVVAAGPL